MTEEQAKEWLSQLSQQTGVSVGETDVANLAGKNPEDVAQFQQDLQAQYARRAEPTSSSGGPAPTGMSNAAFPYPERVQMPDPTAPAPYSATYQPQPMSPFQSVGEEDRNRLLLAILGQPDTMGETQQTQLFEQQKELLNAQRAQQQSQLAQNLAQRGIAGGALTAGLGTIGQEFGSQLLSAQRDIALKAAQQNRADQLAALEMQQAMAQGDFQRMAAVYQANQIERANTENFLRQAAELTQTGGLAYNQQRLAQATAQQNEVMDFYRFLELQRQFQNNLYSNYFGML